MEQEVPGMKALRTDPEELRARLRQLERCGQERKELLALLKLKAEAVCGSLQDSGDAAFSEALENGCRQPEREREQSERLSRALSSFAAAVEDSREDLRGLAALSAEEMSSGVPETSFRVQGGQLYFDYDAAETALPVMPEQVSSRLGEISAVLSRAEAQFLRTLLS